MNRKEQTEAIATQLTLIRNSIVQVGTSLVSEIAKISKTLADARIATTIIMQDQAHTSEELAKSSVVLEQGEQDLFTPAAVASDEAKHHPITSETIGEGVKSIGDAFVSPIRHDTKQDGDIPTSSNGESVDGDVAPSTDSAGEGSVYVCQSCKIRTHSDSVLTVCPVCDAIVLDEAIESKRRLAVKVKKQQKDAADAAEEEIRKVLKAKADKEKASGSPADKQTK